MSRTDGPGAGRLFEIFFDLVRIDSESGNEAALCAYIKDFCARLGFSFQEDSAGAQTGGQCGNLVVRVPAGAFSPLPPVLLCAHMDTVRPSTHVLPFDMGDRFVSMSETVLGADCKAGVASLLAVAEWLASSGGPYRALELVFTVQEEPGLLGARNMDMSLVDAEWGVVLDGSGPVGGIVVEAPSQDRFAFSLRGRAAHAGVEPEKGVSAITAAARAVASLPQGRLDGATTINVGLISGGVAANIVPEFAVVEGEVRSLDDVRLETERQVAIDTFKRAAEETGCELTYEVERSFEHFRLDESSRAVRFLAAALRECGFEPKPGASGGGSDANVLNLAGIDTAVMNIGLVNAHSKEEYILKDELHGMARVVGALAHLAGGEGAR